MNPRKARDMDDQAATKVIAAIERLSNRIAKLDETSVEAAAIANEARRAAMDAADATNPKQTAKFLSERVNPVLENFDREFRSSMGKMDEVLSGLLTEVRHAGATFKAAYGDAAFVAREHKRRSRNLLISTGVIGFFMSNFCEAAGVADCLGESTSGPSKRDGIVSLPRGEL